jgi:hypothetical protein
MLQRQAQAVGRESPPTSELSAELEGLRAALIA